VVTVVSILGVNHVCYRVSHDPGFLAALREDPAKALAGLDLDDEERAGLIAGDVGALYRRGAHPLLLVRLAQAGLFGLTHRSYIERLRAAVVSQ
jgi:hypothetical protein